MWPSASIDPLVVGHTHFPPFFGFHSAHCRSVTTVTMKGYNTINAKKGNKQANKCNTSMQYYMTERTRIPSCLFFYFFECNQSAKVKVKQTQPPFVEMPTFLC